MRGVESGSTRRPASSFPSASLRCGDTEGELELELDEEEDDDDGIRQTAPPKTLRPHKVWNKEAAMMKPAFLDAQIPAALPKSLR